MCVPVAGRRELLRNAGGGEDGEKSQLMPSIKGNSITNLGLNSTCFQDRSSNKRILLHLQLMQTHAGVM